ncbi:hypothetical protein [Neorhodopirellula lusitana]|uniref:hypothetical protein n=1 Tax=Neorhodopirellula lusitana TaxID=445327 RepID=UPI00384C7ED1
MIDEPSDNPYASPRSFQCTSDSEDLNEITPRWVVLIALVFGFMNGGVSSYIRPMISGPIHYEAIVSLVLLVLFFFITLLICLATASPVRWTSLVIAVTWLTYLVGWSLVAQRVFDDMIGVCVGTCLPSEKLVLVNLA